MFEISCCSCILLYFWPILNKTVSCADPDIFLEILRREWPRNNVLCQEAQPRHIFGNFKKFEFSKRSLCMSFLNLRFLHRFQLYRRISFFSGIRQHIVSYQGTLIRGPGTTSLTWATTAPILITISGQSCFKEFHIFIYSTLSPFRCSSFSF